VVVGVVSLTTVAFGVDATGVVLGPLDTVLAWATFGFGAALRVPDVGVVFGLLRLLVVFVRLDVVVLLRVLILASICCSIGDSLS
jgi:hypothetical protein